MKRLLLVVLAAAMVYVVPEMTESTNTAEASRRCRRLARRVRSYKRIRSSYLRSWRRCKWRRGKYSPRCRRLRRAVNRWYRNVSRARSDYRRWGCRFGWSEWNDPWAARRRRARYQAAKCRSLRSRVRSYKRIRASYLRSWRRCKWRSGRYSPRCRRLRRAVNRWYGNVSRARSDYRAWGCRFGWSQWNDPWAARRARARRARYQRAKCRSLARRVRSYKRIRSSYLRSWRRCKWRRGRYSRRCRRLRRSVNRWYSKVRGARSSYRAWGCRFTWGTWNDPWR